VSAVLSLGANLGDRLAALQSAVDLLHPTEVSPVYQSDPVGGPEQPAYLNAVVLVDLDAAAAWSLAQQAEAAAGRRRDVRNGPRTLDVDVVQADGSSPDLRLPHPRAHERAFVLAPWHDLRPDAVLAGHGRVAGLLAAVGTAGVRRRDDLVLRP